VINEADSSYWQAIKAAEEGDLRAAKTYAIKCRKAFFEAKLMALERGPVSELRTTLADNGNIVTKNVRKEAEQELSSLTDAVEDARRDKLDISTLEGRVGACRMILDRLLNGSHSNGGGGTPQYPDWPLDPETLGPPKAPVAMRITGRSTTWLKVTWRDLSGVDAANRLERKEGNRPWELAAELGSLAGTEFVTYTDNGLKPDTEYRYRVRVESPFGTSITSHDNQACGATLSGFGVWRVELKIRVADVPRAGTEDSVRIRLNSPLFNYSPNSNSTWLNYGPRRTGNGLFWVDDFARGSEFTYDLLTEYVSDLGDITMISISKEGTDALGIAEMSLIVNGKEVFNRLFGDTASTCLWLDEGEGYGPVYSMYHTELRADPRWHEYLANPAPAPFVIPNAEIVKRLEGLIGDLIHGTDLQWDPDQFYGLGWVEAKQLDNRTLKVDVDLAAAVPVLDDPEVDLDFEVTFDISCLADRVVLTLTVGNFDSGANFDWVIDVLAAAINIPGGPIAIKLIETYIAEKVGSGLHQIVQEIAIIAPEGICPSVVVSDDGDVEFHLN
jgi:hypothetical protein